MRHLFLSLVFIILSIQFVFSQANDKQTKTYTYKKIGWTVTVPAEWKIISNDDFDKLQQTGLDSIEKKSDGGSKDNMLDEKVINLISVKRDETNFFLSTIQAFDATKYNFHTSMDMTDTLVVGTFNRMNLKCDTSSENVKVDGLNFHVFHIKLHVGKDKIFYEDLYCRLIKGYLFGVITGYTNDVYKNIIQDIVKYSKFTIRN